MNERIHITVQCPGCKGAIAVVNPYYVFHVFCATCRVQYPLEYEEVVDPEDQQPTDTYWIRGQDD